jgi:hypothetical protein
MEVLRGERGREGKRARKTVNYAKYGLLSGSVEEARGVRDRPTCGILAHGRWPSWALILKVGGFDLKWIMGLRSDLHATLRNLFPNAELLSPNIVDSVLKTYPVTLVLCERRWPIQSCALWTMPRLWGVLSSKKIQGSLPFGWYGHESSLRHVDVGGATDGVWSISAATRSSKDPGIFRVDASPMGNLISCIDQSLIGSRCSAPPPRAKVPGVYRHGGIFCAMDGLYPRESTAQERFLVPSFRSSTKWCARVLSAAEIFSVWDVTPNLTTGLGPEDLKELVGSTAPLKVIGLVLRNVVFIGKNGRARVSNRQTCF